MNSLERLEGVLQDLILEQQIKLGYRPEAVRLYFPLSSLEHLTGAWGAPAVKAALADFSASRAERFGEIGVSHRGDQYCLAFSEQAGAYVHEHVREDHFLVAFLKEITSPSCSFDTMLSLFCRYSDQIHVESMLSFPEREFDYLFYFPTGKPNDYRYLITFEELHAVYHRFTPEDYLDYGFPKGQVIRA